MQRLGRKRPCLHGNSEQQPGRLRFTPQTRLKSKHPFLPFALPVYYDVDSKSIK
jgi:hypothetical protein